MMRFASLGSGSSGNALLVEVNHTRVLIDCGFNFKQTQKRLERLGMAPSDINAVLLTHEHSDHVGGVAAFVAKTNASVFMSYGTHQALNGNAADWRVSLFDSHEVITVGDLHITPFPVPHDARQPVQFILSDGAKQLAIMTDLGKITGCAQRHIDNVDAIVIECNHDATMLKNGPYPEHLKKRIRGDFGHLENDDAANALLAMNTAKLRHVVAAHLSRHNNCPLKVREKLSQALNCTPDWIGVADQQTGFDWREI
ncbi:MAG: MBL fold metallo-hydrolase [Burkholderiales bacterium]|jgi:phosphoribosyl 1,2-cyclic phosphodiesterase|nr:MBL fold metallo-hydrolase [Burkholderiales bacterium]